MTVVLGPTWAPTNSAINWSRFSEVGYGTGNRRTKTEQNKNKNVNFTPDTVLRDRRQNKSRS